MVRRKPVRLQVQYLLLEHILHLAPGAVHRFVKGLGFKSVVPFLKPFSREIGDHKAGILPRGHHLRLGYNPPIARPTFHSLIPKIAENTGRHPAHKTCRACAWAMVPEIFSDSREFCANPRQ